MKLTLLTTLLLTSLTALHAAPPDLSKITSRADLDATIAATKDPALRQAFTDAAVEILLAAEQHPHVEAVIRTIDRERAGNVHKNQRHARGAEGGGRR